MPTPLAPSARSPSATSTRARAAWRTSSRRAGVTRGDRLCVHLANGVEFLDLFLACMRIGVIFVPMNILYRERELRHIVTDAAPRAIVVEPGTDAVYPERDSAVGASRR